ncbi:hypothetical protein [Actinomadura sp. 6N118]|uniref:hypothetical protein n=1 Tax=Actinomadura sp. 6N118 TaxID=3375151 RepID=UPI0037A1ECCB
MGTAEARSENLAGIGKLVVMWTIEQRTGARRRRDPVLVMSPVQSFLFGHSRAEVVYDCR